MGKSSLLRAAVARSLRALPEEPLVVVFSSWSDDPNAALAEAVGEATGTAVDGSAVAALEQAQSGRDVYLVLDQAEEYFLYHADDGGPGSFAEALPTVVGSLARVNVLISLREDSLAKLDRFTGRVPGLFSNTLRLDRLDRRSAGAAILRPVERYAELTGESIAVEPELVERVLDEVGAGQIEPALGGLGAVEGVESAARIEAPYLQLVMQRIWEEERAAGSSELRAATLERLGGAQHIVEEHLEGAMAELAEDEKDIAARLFNHLVTPSGTKIAHDTADLAEFGDVPVSKVEPVLAPADAPPNPSLPRGGRSGPVRDLPRRARAAGARVAGRARGRAGARGAETRVRPPPSPAAGDHRSRRRAPRNHGSRHGLRGHATRARRASRLVMRERTSSSRPLTPSSDATRS